MVVKSRGNLEIKKTNPESDISSDVKSPRLGGVDDRVTDSKEDVADDHGHGDDEPGEHEVALLRQHAEHEEEVLGEGDAAGHDGHDQDRRDGLLEQLEGGDKFVVNLLFHLALVVEFRAPEVKECDIVFQIFIQRRINVLLLELVERLKDLDIVVEPEGVEGDARDPGRYAEEREDQ